jgi:hypothetical protein
MTGHQHLDHLLNNHPHESNLLRSPSRMLENNSPVNSSHPNLSSGKTCSTNAPRQPKRKNCKLPRMGSHSQLPTALILQTLPVFQISRL